MKLPKQNFEKYLDAVRDEQDNWMRWGGVRPLTRKEARQVFADKKMSRRILRSRAAYRVQSGADRAPRSGHVPIDYEPGFWKLWISDAKSAFLQGERNHPRDPLMLATGAFSEVLGNCFGRPGAPRVWNKKVHKRLTENGFTQHGFDKCLYYFADEQGHLRAVMMVHVDDFLCTSHQDFDEGILRLRDVFVWGSVTIVEPGSPGTVRGKEIYMVERGSGRSS